MLWDTAHALIHAEMDSHFQQMCQQIHNERQSRGKLLFSITFVALLLHINRIVIIKIKICFDIVAGESPSKFAPPNYRVIPQLIKNLDSGIRTFDHIEEGMAFKDDDNTEIESNVLYHDAQNGEVEVVVWKWSYHCQRTM